MNATTRRRRWLLSAALALAVCAAGYGQTSQQSDRLLFAARQLYESGLYDQALETAVRLLDLPESEQAPIPQALSLLAACYERAGRATEGLAYFDAKAREWPGARGRAARCGAGELLMRQYRFTQALERLEALLGEIPPEASAEWMRAQYLAGLCLYYSGLYEKAGQTFAGLERDPALGNLSARMLGECLLEAGRQDLFEQLARRISGRDADSRLLSARYDLMNGRTQSVQRAYEQGEPDAARRNASLLDLASLYRQLGSYKLSDRPLTRIFMPSPEASLLHIRNLMSQDRLDEAAAEIARQLPRAGEETAADLMFLKGDILWRRQNPGEALEVFQSILARLPDYRFADECAYRVGLCLMRLNRCAEAVEFLTRRMPAAADAEFRRLFLKAVGDCHLFLRNFDQARRFYNDALQYCQTSPQEQEIKLLIGKTWYYDGEWAEAMKQFDQLAHEAQDPQTAVLCRYLTGWVCVRQGDWAGAVIKFRAVAKQRTFGGLKARALFQLGNLHFLQGRYAAAGRYYGKIILWMADTDRKIAEFSLYRSALCLRRTGNGDGARARLLELLARYPRSRYAAAIRFELGCIEYDRNNLAAARHHFLRLVRDDPSGPLTPDALFWAARAASQQGDWAEAAGLLEKLASGPEPTHYARAARSLEIRACWRLGRKDQARALASRLYEARPGDPEGADAARLLGRMEFADGRWKEALDWLDRAGAGGFEPDPEEDLYERAECLVRLGREDEAVTAFVQAFFGARKPGASVARSAYEAAGLLEKKGRFRDAVLIYNALARLCPDQSREARRRARALRGAAGAAPAS